MLQQLRVVPQLHRRRTTACRPDVKAASAAAADASGVAPGEKTFLGIAYFTWAKILPLGLMFFCILFNYTILRDTKVSPVACWPSCLLQEDLASIRRSQQFTLVHLLCRMCLWLQLQVAVLRSFLSSRPG